LVVPAAFVQESIMSFVHSIRQFIRDEEGVTAIEYGLIAALIAVAIIASLEGVRDALIRTFEAVSGAMPA
jgi:pilus assembly protein Flp/PilA